MPSIGGATRLGDKGFSALKQTATHSLSERVSARSHGGHGALRLLEFLKRRESATAILNYRQFGDLLEFR